MDIKTQVVYNHLPKISAALKPKASMIVRKAALDIEAGAKSRAPVLTGALRASIQSVQVNSLHWRVTVGADYGIYQEYGTVFLPPRPFLNPAIDAVRPIFILAMRKVVG